MYIMDLVPCDSSQILKVMWLFKLFIKALGIVVPVILTVSLMISITVNLLKGETDQLAFLKQKLVPRFIAAVIVFMIPSGVDLLMDLLGARADFSTCYNNADETYIALREDIEKVEAEMKKQQDAQKLEQWKQELASLQAQAVQYTTNWGGSGNGGTGTVPSGSGAPSGGSVPQGGTSPGVSGSTVSFGGYTWQTKWLPYNALVNGKIVTLSYENYEVPITYEGKTKKSTSINSEIKDNLNAILANVAHYVKTNETVNKITNAQIRTAGVYNPNPDKQSTYSYHSFAQAIDLYSDWAFTNNGKTYYPYSGMGDNTWSRYKKFLCDNCGGKEDCIYNINYTIFNTYFKGNGWCWGGNWGPGSFDPMHFEYKGNESKCYTSNKKAITC